jgi:hypothetical protein
MTQHEFDFEEEDALPTPRQASLDAYRSVNITKHRRIVMEILREHGPMTDEVLAVQAAYQGVTPSSARGRRKELKRLGHVRLTSKKGRTKNKKWCCIWEAT